MSISKKEMIIQIQNFTALLVVNASGLNIGKKESSTPRCSLLIKLLSQTGIIAFSKSMSRCVLL